MQISIPQPPFEEIFEANNDSATCAQNNERLGIVGDLDCLQLNVYVPKSASSKNRLPVLAYIYGGSFKQGFFSRTYYGPRFLVRHEIILIVINYRVGAYGFLCLDTPDVSGNQGFKDQLTAFRWIRDNIESFGGDPDRVTLAGQSSGAATVHLHLLYAKERLFDKVILASGTIYWPLLLTDTNNTVALKLAEHLGFPTNDVSEAISYLAKVHPHSLVETEAQLGLKYAGCNEKPFENITSFISDYPKNIEIPKDVNISILIGNTEDESHYEFSPKNLEYFEKNDIMNKILKNDFVLDADEYRDLYKTVRDFYINDLEISETYKQKVIDFHSDFYLNYPTKRGMEKYIQNGVKVFQYVLSYCGGRNYIKNERNLTNKVATHCDELGYIFDIPLPFMNKDTPLDLVVLDRFTTMWTNFIKFGDPTPKPTRLLPFKWKPVTNDTSYYMNIDSDLSLRKNHFHDRMAFWNLFFEVYGEKERGFKSKQQLINT